MSHRHSPASLMEALETRTLLSWDPASFPNVNTDLEATTNPVVLVETTMGNIYWELFPGDAPGHVANLLDYIEDGRYPFHFFHRLVSGFVLQGGEFVWSDATQTLSTVEEFPAVTNEFNRTNAERTIALAKVGGDPNSGRNQFFINLANNAGTPPFGLDFQNGGFTVFARVAGNASWAVVQAIAALPTTDDFFSMEPTSALGEVPVTPAHNNGDPMSEAALVRVLGMSLIKEEGSTEYYVNRLAFPEGFRGDDDVVQAIQAVNMGTTAGSVQVWARYENGRRDRLVGTFAMAANESRTIVLSDFEDTGNELLRESAPVAFELRGTTLIGATMVREDFGAVTTESFFNVDQIGSSASRNWILAEQIKAPGITPFVVWQNLSDQTATITLRFYLTDGTEIVRVVETEAYRRGGLNISQCAFIPDGAYALHVTSDQNIVVAQSQYETVPGSVGSDTTRGHTGGLTPGPFANEGMLAGAIRRPGETTYLTVFNSSSSTGAVVRIIAHLDDRSQFQLAPIIVIPAGERFFRFDFSGNTTLPTDEFFTLRFNSPTVPVAVQYTGYADGDSFSTPFQITGGDSAVFGFGSLDLANTNHEESISVFNPYSSVLVTYDYGIRFRFSDGTLILGAGGNLGAMQRVTINTRDLLQVTNKIQSNPALFSTYSIEVLIVATDGVGPVDGLAVAQYHSVDRTNGQVVTTIGSPLSNAQPLAGPGIGG